MNAAQFEVFQDDAGEWRWRLKAGNGEIVAQSESYGSRSDAREGAEACAFAASNAVLVD